MRAPREIPCSLQNDLLPNLLYPLVPLFLVCSRVPIVKSLERSLVLPKPVEETTLCKVNASGNYICVSCHSPAEKLTLKNKR